MNVKNLTDDSRLISSLTGKAHRISADVDRKGNVIGALRPACRPNLKVEGFVRDTGNTTCDACGGKSFRQSPDILVVT
jgi:hypothetical protein